MLAMMIMRLKAKLNGCAWVRQSGYKPYTMALSTSILHCPTITWHIAAPNSDPGSESDAAIFLFTSSLLSSSEKV